MNNMLALKEIIANDNIDELIDKLIEFPQSPCPIRHIFGGGIYIREITVGAGVFLIGQYHKTTHMNHMVKGKVIMLNLDGTTTEVSAGATFTCPPGRKIGLVLEEMVWHNIHATDETDIDKLEDMYIDKHPAGEKAKQKCANLEYVRNHYVREDFNLMLEDLNVTKELVQTQSEITTDLIPLPPGNYKMKVTDSYIQGKGVFVTSPVKAGEAIAPARFNGCRTPAGRYTNHSPTPNARMELQTNGDLLLIAICDIDGCYGNSNGKEVTVDYRQVVAEKGDT